MDVMETALEALKVAHRHDYALRLDTTITYELRQLLARSGD
ncbi:MAG: hypothetical protein RQ985_08935 [Dehalococcoidia bacterium]|nr:hypothetical protein [Dehalococcoidia bacterium]